eukprot:208311_1
MWNWTQKYRVYHILSVIWIVVMSVPFLKSHEKAENNSYSFYTFIAGDNPIGIVLLNFDFLFSFCILFVYCVVVSLYGCLGYPKAFLIFVVCCIPSVFFVWQPWKALDYCSLWYMPFACFFSFFFHNVVYLLFIYVPPNEECDEKK